MFVSTRKQSTVVSRRDQYEAELARRQTKRTIKSARRNEAIARDMKAYQYTSEEGK